MIATEPWLDYALVVGGFILAAGWMVSQWRMGRVRGAEQAVSAANEALSLQAAELQTLREVKTRLEAELTNARTQIESLREQARLLRQENAELRKLVMMESVPGPLVEVMQGIAAQVVRDIVEFIQGQGRGK